MSDESATNGQAGAAGGARGPLPLVLLPGHMCDARMWAPQVAALSASRSLHLPRDARASSVAEAASAVLAEAPPRFALAGLSMGGILAMEVLRQAPHRVERLALLDTNPLPEAPEVAEARMARMGRVARGELDAVVTCEMKPLYLAPGPRRTDILDLCLDMARSLGPEAFLRQSRALIDRPDQRATLASFKGPALVLMGAEDRLCPRDRHELMASLMPQATFVVIEGAGHLPPLEQPGATNAALRRWLEDDDAPSRARPEARPRDAGAPARHGHADGVQRGGGGGGPARLRPLH